MVMKNLQLLAVALTLLVTHQQHGGGVIGSLNRSIFSFDEDKGKVVKNTFSSWGEEISGGGEKAVGGIEETTAAAGGLKIVDDIEEAVAGPGRGEQKVSGGIEEAVTRGMVSGGMEEAVARRGEKKFEAEGAMEQRGVEDVDADMKLYLRKRDPGSQVDDLSSENAAIIASLSNDANEIFSKIREISSDDVDIDDSPDVLKATANALTLLKDRISDPQVISSMPPDFQDLFNSLLSEVSSAEKHVEKVENLVSEHYIVRTPDSDISKAKPRKRLLSNEESSLPLKFNSGLSKADYHSRATRSHMQVHQRLEKGSDHQQGYHKARVHRQEGGMNRRLNEGNTCVDLDPEDRKEELCTRLAECAKNYNLYDLFVFFFGDDIDFNTGSVDSKEKIKAADESDLIGKLNTIKDVSNNIIEVIANDGVLSQLELDEGGRCDTLLQEFHRFDEDLSVKGKWQGGTVTGICRGWGTNNFMTLESVYHISDTTLNFRDRVEKCLQGLVVDFNRKRERFVVPENPCLDALSTPGGGYVELDWGWDVGLVVYDIKRKFECLQLSFLDKINKECPTTGNTLCLRATTGTDASNDGHVEIQVDSGEGYVTVNDKDHLYATGSTVVDQCFDTILGVQITAPGTNGWAGSVTLSTDRGTNYSPLTCTDCTGTTADTASIVVDNNADESALATTHCLSGNVCNLEHNALPSVKCNTFACELYQPVFEAKNILGNFYGSPPFVFDFEIPAVLPPDRSRNDGYGAFLVDMVPTKERSAERFLIEVFSEYVGCATDLVRSLGGGIFSFSDEMYNPYAPDTNNPDQFQLPLKIIETAIDEHGQIIVDKLDGIFQYQSVGFGPQKLIDIQETPQLNGDLKDYLAEVYHFDQTIDDWIKYYEDDCPDGQENECKALLKVLKDMRDFHFEMGLDRTSLDTSIALVFGNKTTIGQVCSFARGLEDGMVDDLPGFCCLDAPYEAQEWGEKYSCEKYITLVDGSTKVVQKSTTDCNRLGPITSGFNEAACDVFHGTWCPTPRSCAALVNCINEAKVEVEENRDRGAFFEYLDGAPSVKFDEVGDPKKCGDLREYFDYDREYPDDDRICGEVLDLQCFTDFSNLDDFATGTAGPGDAGGMAELAVSENLRLITKVPFDSSAAKAWRSANYGLQKTIGILFEVIKAADLTVRVCTVAISMIPGTSGPCTFPAAAIEAATSAAKFAVDLAFDLSGRIYAELVDVQNAKHVADRQMSIYENVITNHGNILTTFWATQQLKVMLGEISDGLAEDREREEEEERRMLESCVSVAETGYYEGCTDVTCEDITRLCDGSFNFPFVAFLKGAGCDKLDSDGDGKIDNCEDRFPPELVVRDAKIFRCNEDDTSQLCYNETVFTSEKAAKNFLEYEFPATDDCQATEILNVRIEKNTDTTCGETVFTLTPEQNISACAEYNPNNPIFNETFVNPLEGTPKHVTLSLDDGAPTVTCGFNDPANNTVFDVETQTLYHYMTVADASDLELKDSNFFYSVTDNCDGEIVDFDDISMVVEFNEVQQNNISRLSTWEFHDGSLRATFLYAPTTCGNVDEDLFCVANPDNVRFYKISVTATDSAGNVGSGSCKVVIVSGCDPSDPECEPCDDAYCGQNNHYDLDYVDRAVANTEELFMINYPYIANLAGAGCDNLDTDADGKIDNCEDRFPPELVFDAKKFMCNEDDTSQLCYNETVFNTEEQALNFLECEFLATDDCQETENLSVAIERVDGTTCRDTRFTLTPWQEIDPSTCNGFVPDNPIYDEPFVDPLAGTTIEVTVPVDEVAPTITCGFHSDDTSINEIVNKTLYHYMTKKEGPDLTSTTGPKKKRKRNQKKAGDGVTLTNAKFFFEVDDNCDDDVNINMVVKSNEVQQNSIAEFFTYQIDGSPPQATFLYGPTTCQNVGQHLYCEKNPDNVRFYSISVTATDSAGNVASDSCDVVIISNCVPSQAGCKKYNATGKVNSFAYSHYYEMDYVIEAVSQPQGLFTVASTELVVSVENNVSAEQRIETSDNDRSST